MLTTVLAVSVVITLLLSGVLLLAYYRNLTVLKLTLAEELERNAQSGIQYALGNSQPGETVRETFDLYGRTEDSITVTQQPWGVFTLVTAAARRGCSP